jgi:hypothetical protein
MSLAQRSQDDDGRKPPGVRLLSAADPAASMPVSAPKPEPIEGRVFSSQNDVITATLDWLRLLAGPPAAESPAVPGTAGLGVAIAGPPAASAPSEDWPTDNTASDGGGCIDSRREGALDVVCDEGALASDVGGIDDLKDRVH